MQYEHRELGLGTWVLWNLEYWLILHKISHNNNGLEKEISVTINLSNKVIKVVNFRVNNLDWAVNFGGSSLVKERFHFWLPVVSIMLQIFLEKKISLV